MYTRDRREAKKLIPAKLVPAPLPPGGAERDPGATIGWLAAPAVGVPSWVKMTDAYTLRRGYASPPTLAVILKTEENIIFEFYEFRISQCAGPGQVGICPCDQSS